MLALILARAMFVFVVVLFFSAMVYCLSIGAEREAGGLLCLVCAFVYLMEDAIV